MIRARLSCLVVGAAIGLMSCAVALAHVETGVELKGKTLVGLPSQYSPAELDLEAFRIRIGHHAMEFSPFLSSFFRRQPYDLRVSASWYHGGPPYLVLEIAPKGRDYSYNVVLALDTLRLLGLSVDLRSAKEPPKDFTTQTLPIELTDFQKKEIDESIKNVP